MNYKSILFAGLLALAILTAGCGDENCPVRPPANEAPELYVIGEASVQGDWLRALIDVYNTAGTDMKVDSASGDGQWLCIKEIPHSVSDDGHQLLTWFGMDACPSGVLPPFFPEDTTEFAIYCRGVPHYARLPLLDYENSMPRNLHAEADSALSEVQVDWSPVSGADWYSLKVGYSAIIASIYAWEYFCVDTTKVTLPLWIPHPYMRDVKFYVAAGTGPMPGDSGREGNISGDHISGDIYSLSSEAYFYLPIHPDGIAGNIRSGARISPPSIRELLRRS